MSKESKPKKTRSTKSNTADLEAKIAELEARLANLSDQVQPGARPAETRSAPKPQASRGTLPAGFKSAPKTEPQPSPKAEVKPAPRPTASGPTHGTLPAGFKPAPKPAPKPDIVESELPEAAGEVAPAYATISSTEYTGNRYFATRKRLSYHPQNKQFTGSTAKVAPTPEPPKPKVRRGTLPAGFK
jgi:hypothetical protein